MRRLSVKSLQGGKSETNNRLCHEHAKRREHNCGVGGSRSEGAEDTHDVQGLRSRLLRRSACTHEHDADKESSCIDSAKSNAPPSGVGASSAMGHKRGRDDFLMRFAG
jgi:hypothetical protein